MLSSSCGERGHSVAVLGLLMLQTTGSRTHELQWLQRVDSGIVAPGLSMAGSVVVAHGLSCSVPRGIFPDRAMDPCLLHWQVVLYYRATREAPR